jgi:hypothetical protein
MPHSGGFRPPRPPRPPQSSFQTRTIPPIQPIRTPSHSHRRVSSPVERKRTKLTEATDCCICTELIAKDEEVEALPCSHTFHIPCLREWIKRNATCPLCRVAI